MKHLAKPLTALLMMITISTFAQKAEIFQEGKKYGLKTDFGKELLPADYIKITKCKTDTLDYYIAELTGSAELYSYNPQKRDIFDEAQKQKFTIINFQWNATTKSNEFVAYDATGNKSKLTGNSWNTVKIKEMIGCKDGSGKYAVCQGGKALTGYNYNDVMVVSSDMVAAKTDSGWIAMDNKMKSAYGWSFDEVHKSDEYPECFIIRKGNKWGILSVDGTMNLPPSDMKNPQGMFDFDGDSYAELKRGYAVMRGGKWGVVSEKNEVLVPFDYENAYMIDDFAIEQYNLTVHAIVKNGGTWKFLNEKWEEHKAVQFDKWLGVHGDVALVSKGGKVEQMDLKTFETNSNLYFGEYDDENVIKNEDGTSGVVDKTGNIIMPFEYAWISMEEEGEIFYIAERKGKDGIYSEDGKMVVSHDYEGLVSLVTIGEKHYFQIGHEGKAALGWWDKSSNKLISLTEGKYRSVNYKAAKKVFSAHTMDDEYIHLDHAGNVMEEE
jgi:hypothetical protein